MAYTQANNPFKKLLSDIGSGLSKLNIKSPSMSSSTRGVSGQRAYQQAQLKRPSHLRESKFEYDVRMRKEARKKAQPVTRTPEQLEGIDPKSEIKGTFSTAETYTGGFSTNPNDKRDQSQPLNFGIIPGMSFGEAFAQAGLGGAQAGKSTFFWTNPDLEKNPEQKEKTFLYEHEEKPTLKEYLKSIASQSPTATVSELTDILRTAKKEYLQR